MHLCPSATARRAGDTGGIVRGEEVHLCGGKSDDGDNESSTSEDMMEAISNASSSGSVVRRYGGRC